MYFVLISIFFAIKIGIGAYLVYYKYMNRNEENVSGYDFVCQSKNYANVWNGIKNKINFIKESDYEKAYMKIKFNSGDDLPLNKPLKFHPMTIIIRCIFEEHGKFHLKFFR